ncbi:adenosylcobinamide-GDP ribazoletransferase [Candidatus Marinarcus aquaticus]|uniref:Adenosylcobinamide-GDP ribazoletransferase n=1 Tax=Candidatus Marinarcus aquaticus TaxID=2044504 RepID=A0A4Q0XM83_9BACT|nr:adenosylcobinamide-GDP ribazoletransferase [Candidatus Marinarcus aquaticus]RXJ53774.1 adenosylcobinamide-GDP ribazoletransferase [Candidatus Marinarcus aquaticus]
MRYFLDGIFLSFSYFSILPLGSNIKKMHKMTYDGVLFGLPLVGFIIGLISAASFLFLKGFMPLEYSAIVSACIYLVLYGFLHLEAVCDVVDAWYASLSGKDVYSIMKEPHVGAIGAIATFILVLLKVSVMVTLFLNGLITLALAAMVFSRLGLAFSLNWFKVHKNSTFAQELKKSAKGKLLVVMLIAYMILVYFALNVNAVLLFAVVSIVAFTLILRLLKSKFGFLNGDCLGFTLEVVELILLNIGLMLL